jgi:hypothetical protein
LVGLSGDAQPDNGTVAVDAFLDETDGVEDPASGLDERWCMRANGSLAKKHSALPSI